MAWLTDTKRLNRDTGKKEVYWAIQWRTPEGKTRTKGIGFLTKPEAKQMLTVFEGKLASGEPVEPPPTERGSAATAAEVAPALPTLAVYLTDTYLPVVARDRAVRTHLTAQCAAKALTRHMGATTLDHIDYAAVDAYLTKRQAEGVRSRTLILDLKCLRGALRLAVNHKLLMELPPMPTVRDRDRQTPKFLTPDESRRLLAAAMPDRPQGHVVTRGKPPERRDELTYLAILFGLNLGLRKQEILTRRYEDVRWGQGPHGVLVVGSRPEIGFQVKTRRERAVPLTPEVRSELDRLHHALGNPGVGWIFPTRDTTARPRADFRKGLSFACRRAGLEHIHPHALRHTWATRLAMAGVDRRTLMDLGGWTEGRMLDEVYAHTTGEHMQAVMSRSGIGPPKVLEEHPPRPDDT
ncbi:MAG: site-specific integrase [Pseudomonadota bacterium]|nr:site-specific integrase [Pseudomonadota bacterium]